MPTDKPGLRQKSGAESLILQIKYFKKNGKPA